MNATSIEFEPSRDLVVAVSWRIIAELMRGYSEELTVLEMHPGGGMYDCLRLIRTGEGIAEGTFRIELNRHGSAHITSADGRGRSWPDFWKEALSRDDLRSVVDEIKAIAELPRVHQLPSSSGTVVAYRLIARVLAAHVFDREHWDCRNGVLDSSGYADSGLRTEWFAEFPAAESLRVKASAYSSEFESGYRFWFLLKNDKPIAAFDAPTGTWWPPNGGGENLLKVYKSKGRSIERVACHLMTPRR